MRVQIKRQGRLRVSPAPPRPEPPELIFTPCCKCGRPPLDPHECPFASEIHNDPRECDCCEACIQECGEAI
jgi:hypothetical protein